MWKMVRGQRWWWPKNMLAQASEIGVWGFLPRICVSDVVELENLPLSTLALLALSLPIYGPSLENR